MWVKLARTWSWSLEANARPPGRQGVSVEVLRQLGDGGSDGVASLAGGMIITTVIGRRRLAGRGGGDSVVHWK